MESTAIKKLKTKYNQVLLLLLLIGILQLTTSLYVLPKFEVYDSSIVLIEQAFDKIGEYELLLEKDKESYHNLIERTESHITSLNKDTVAIGRLSLNILINISIIEIISALILLLLLYVKNDY